MAIIPTRLPRPQTRQPHRRIARPKLPYAASRPSLCYSSTKPHAFPMPLTCHSAPMLAVGDGDLWLLSTPALLARFLLRSLGPHDEWERHTAPPPDAPASAHASFLEEMLAMGEAALPRSILVNLAMTGTLLSSRPRRRRLRRRILSRTTYSIGVDLKRRDSAIAVVDARHDGRRPALRFDPIRCAQASKPAPPEEWLVSHLEPHAAGHAALHRCRRTRRQGSPQPQARSRLPSRRRRHRS